MILAVVVVALVNLAALARPESGLLQGRLADPDAYLRLIRVLELHDGLGWYHTVTSRVAAPDGLSVHWTRPLDLLILLPGWAFATLGGLRPHAALELTGILVSPVLHVAAAIAAAWATRAIWPGLAPWYAVLMAVATPAATGYSILGRADHHTLLLLALTLGLGAALRALSPPADSELGCGSPRAAWLAGAAFGCGIWVSPEALIIAMPVLAATGLALLLAPDGRSLAAQGLRMSLGMVAVLVLAVATERAPADWLQVEYDKVSIHHLVLALLVAAVFAVAQRVGSAAPSRRTLTAGAAGAAALAVLLALFPGTLHGSLGEADEVTMLLFHPSVQEMQPLPPFGPGGPKEILMTIGGPVFAGLLAIGLAFGGWVRDGRWPAALALGAALLAGLAAAFGARRFGLDLAAPASIAAAGLVGLVLHGAWPTGAGLRAGLGALALFGTLGLPFLGLVGTPPPSTTAFSDATKAAGCDSTEMIRWLDRERPGVTPAQPDPVLMAADIYLGPELAWRSPYRAVTGPYHRGGAAIGDTLVVFGAREEARARAVLARRGIGLLLFCKAKPEIGLPEESLGNAIRDGHPPAWLVPVSLPETLSGYRLYRVIPEGGR